MTPTRALRVIPAVAGFGLFLSGFLSHGELFGERALSCPAVLGLRRRQPG